MVFVRIFFDEPGAETSSYNKGKTDNLEFLFQIFIAFIKTTYVQNIKETLAFDKMKKKNINPSRLTSVTISSRSD